MTKDERVRELLEHLERRATEFGMNPSQPEHELLWDVGAEIDKKLAARNLAPHVSDIRWEPFTEGEKP